MKKNLIIAVSLLCGFSAFSQNNHQPPARVAESFHREYPQSQATSWAHNGNDWTVNFEDRDHNDGDVIAHFDHNGRHMATYVPYDNHDVPNPIVHRLHSKYAVSDDYEVTRIEHQGDHDYYRVRFHHNNGYRTVYFDHKGNEKKYPYHQY
jgi:hypothetical protein